LGQEVKMGHFWQKNTCYIKPQNEDLSVLEGAKGINTDNANNSKN
jgi:hypothetical protein